MLNAFYLLNHACSCFNINIARFSKNKLFLKEGIQLLLIFCLIFALYFTKITFKQFREPTNSNTYIFLRLVL